MGRWFFVFAIMMVPVTVTIGSSHAGSPTKQKSAVTVNEIPIPRATSSIDSSIEAIEFRSGDSDQIRLVPGSKRYAVCITARSPVSLLDAQLPSSAPTGRFTVGVEDGRHFANCLLVSLSSEGSGAKHRYIYCLRCEDVTLPP